MMDGGELTDAAAPPAPPPLLKRLSIGHERALRAEWDATEQATLDSVLAKLPVSKHSALERCVFFFRIERASERCR